MLCRTGDAILQAECYHSTHITFHQSDFRVSVGSARLGVLCCCNSIILVRGQTETLTKVQPESTQWLNVHPPVGDLVWSPRVIFGPRMFTGRDLMEMRVWDVPMIIRIKRQSDRKSRDNSSHGNTK